MTKVIVGLSGGVDSAVAAYLLKKQGYEVVGAFMRNWDALVNNDIMGNPTYGDICPQEIDYNDAKKVADKLGIPLLRIDFVKEYWDHVFSYFLKEYQEGRTPNPDVLCNKYIKFDAFLKFAYANGADYIATGHYAKKVDGKLCKAFDKNKDQSYFLSLLNQEQIDATIFPLGDIEKPEVRRIAAELGLEIANKKDSTGICFIGERDFRKFLKNYIPARPGKIIEVPNMLEVGKHEGVMYYTIGQRKGLGIGGIANHKQGSYYVCGKDIEKSILYVTQEDESNYLYHDNVIVKDVNYLGERFKGKKQCCAKFRYRQPDQKVEIEFIDDTTIKVHCLEKVRAITEGQICVFYDGEVLLGGGTISKVW